MTAESTKYNMRSLYRTFTRAVTSLALDVLSAPVIAVCKERLGILQEETPKAEPSNPAEVRADTTQNPPHYVGMFVVPCAVGHGHYCQLRRYDNNAWLWTSRKYVNPEHAKRDARQAMQRFGWECIGDCRPGATSERSEAPYGKFDRSEEAAESQRTFGSIISIIMKVDKCTLGPYVGIDKIAHILKRDQALLGNRPFGALQDRVKSEIEDAGEAFARGVNMSKVPMAAISEWVREAKDGKEAFGDALGEIASILERELELDRCALWPESNTPASAPTREVLWKQVESYRTVYASLLEWFRWELAAAKTLNKSGGPVERAMTYLKIIYQREMEWLHEDLEDKASLEQKVAERWTSPVQEAIVERASSYRDDARKAWAEYCGVVPSKVES